MTRGSACAGPRHGGRATAEKSPGPGRGCGRNAGFGKKSVPFRVGFFFRRLLRGGPRGLSLFRAAWRFSASAFTSASSSSSSLPLWFLSYFASFRASAAAFFSARAASRDACFSARAFAASAFSAARSSGLILPSLLASYRASSSVRRPRGRPVAFLARLLRRTLGWIQRAIVVGVVFLQHRGRIFSSAAPRRG